MTRCSGRFFVTLRSNRAIWGSVTIFEKSYAKQRALLWAEVHFAIRSPLILCSLVNEPAIKIPIVESSNFSIRRKLSLIAVIAKDAEPVRSVGSLTNTRLEWAVEKRGRSSNKINKQEVVYVNGSCTRTSPSGFWGRR